MARSPHTSVKVLPTTPSATSRFPNNIRVTRHPPNTLRDLNDVTTGIYSVFNESAPAAAGVTSSPSSGLVFAKRKRSAFKGPMLNTASLAVPSANSAPLTPGFAPGRGTEASREIKLLGRPGTRKSQIIEEEEDAEGEDEEIEEVETFTPDATKTSFEGIHTTDEMHIETLNDENPLPVLAPPADIGPSLHPPRSSSLKEHPESFTESPNGTPDTTVLLPQEESAEPEVPLTATSGAPSELTDSETAGEATRENIESSQQDI
jgi:hypothetical protein